MGTCTSKDGRLQPASLEEVFRIAGTRIGATCVLPGSRQEALQDCAAAVSRQVSFCTIFHHQNIRTGAKGPKGLAMARYRTAGWRGSQRQQKARASKRQASHHRTMTLLVPTTCPRNRAWNVGTCANEEAWEPNTRHCSLCCASLGKSS